MYDIYLNQKKMSKSVGNVVDPFLLLKKFGVEAIRLYFLTNGPLHNDCEFIQNKVEYQYYKVVADEIGKKLNKIVNLILRVTANKVFSIKEIDQNLPLLEEYIDLIIKAKDELQVAEKCLNNYDFANGFIKINNVISLLNSYVHNSIFWKKDLKFFSEMATFVIEMLRVNCIFLKPFLPQFVENIYRYIGIDLKYQKMKYSFYRCKEEHFDTLNSPLTYKSLDSQQLEFNNTALNTRFFEVDAEKKDLIFLDKKLKKV
jgi:methionyl-tRNA synthetase